MIESPEQARRGPNPLAELATAFCLLYIPRMLIRLPAGFRIVSQGWHVAVGMELAAGTALLLLAMSKLHGLAEFFPKTAQPLPGLKDSAGGLLVFFSLTLAAMLPTLMASLTGFKNPLLETFSGSGCAQASLIASMIFSSLAVGYSEELFFRVYAFGMLRKSGMSTGISALCATMVFAGAHSGQGAVGIVSACVLGAMLQIFWIRNRQFHSIALGHALYDFVVLLIVVASEAAG